MSGARVASAAATAGPDRRGAGDRPLRLTRRGRVVIAVAVLLLGAGSLLGLATASRAADPAPVAPTAVVHPGDTLWAVAQRHHPGRDPFAVVDEIRRLNGLDGYTIHPGQRLILPRQR